MIRCAGAGGAVKNQKNQTRLGYTARQLTLLYLHQKLARIDHQKIAGRVSGVDFTEQHRRSRHV
jgi:hypothetical protein